MLKTLKCENGQNAKIQKLSKGFFFKQQKHKNNKTLKTDILFLRIKKMMMQHSKRKMFK